MTGVSGLKAYPLANPHGMGRAIRASRIPVLESGVVHGRLIDLSTAARDVDLEATRIARFQYLDTQHDRRTLSRSQPSSLQIRLNSGVSVSLEGRRNHRCEVVAGDGKVEVGLCVCQRVEPRIQA